jgi:hypothetical protein
LTLPVRAFGGEYVFSLKGFKDLEQASFAREVGLMIDQNLAYCIRTEKVIDAAKQDVQSRDIAKVALEVTGRAQRVLLYVRE